MPRINLVLPTDLHTKIRIHCIQEDIALSDYINEILETSLNDDLLFTHYKNNNEKRTSAYIDSTMYDRLKLYSFINRTSLTRAITSLIIKNYVLHEKSRQLHSAH